MPINAGYEFENAKKKYENAKTLEAKLAGLQEMYSTVPKHKGTENIRAELSKKIALIRHDIEKAAEQKSKRGSGETLAVKKEGCGQIVLVGFPNSGKSTILKALTNADVQIDSHPFTTLKPEIGMMPYLGTQIQLVEIPAIIEGSSGGKANGLQLLSLVRTADAAVLVLNGESPQSEFETLLHELKEVGIHLNSHRPRITIQATETKGISIAGKQFLKIPADEFSLFLKNQGIHNASVIIEEDITTMQQLFDSLNEKLVYKKAFALINFHGQLPRPVDGIRFPTFSFSKPDELKLLSNEFFDLLGAVLVYTKKPGSEPDLQSPMVLKKNSTVSELANHLHKDLAKNLRHAKLYGKNAKFPGQRIQKEYVLQHQDIIEIQA